MRRQQPYFGPRGPGVEHGGPQAGRQRRMSSDTTEREKQSAELAAMPQRSAHWPGLTSSDASVWRQIFWNFFTFFSAQVDMMLISVLPRTTV